MLPSDGRLLPLGGVNGRNPPRSTGCDDVPRTGSDPRLLFVGGLNELNPPRFAGTALLTPRLPTPFVSRAAIPALGLCMVPRANSPPFERPPAGIPLTRFCCIDCRRFEVSCWNDTGRAMLLCDPKKRSEPPLRIVAGEAARPLADKLARDGTTGKLPAIMCAPRNISGRAGIAVMRPPPKCPALTVDMPRPMCWSCMFAIFEKRSPLCSGWMPPKWPPCHPWPTQP